MFKLISSSFLYTLLITWCQLLLLCLIMQLVLLRLPWAQPLHFLNIIFSYGLLLSTSQCSIRLLLLSFLITFSASQLLSTWNMIYSFFLLSCVTLTFLQFIAFLLGAIIWYSFFTFLVIFCSITLLSIDLNQFGLRPLLLDPLIILTCCHVKDRKSVV